MADTLPRYAIDVIIATNTTLSRDAVAGLAHAGEAGRLSGPPVHALSLALIRRLRSPLGDSMAIFGVGGISSGNEALEKIQAGANAVQLYPGLISAGPALIFAFLRAFSLGQANR